MPGAADDPWRSLRARVQQQANYLRNLLPAQPGVCEVCRGPANAGYVRCFTCDNHRRAAQGALADVVAPISYSIQKQQHNHALFAYKGSFDAPQARANLLALLMIFLADHLVCLLKAAGASALTHAAVVPSTRQRPGEHPLKRLIRPHITLPWIDLVADPRHPADLREFRADRFAITGAFPRGAGVLLLDDTWTTGSHLQSAAYMLKTAGAGKVVAVALGRHINPGWQPWLPILTMVGGQPYRLDLCPVHDPGSVPQSRRDGPS